MIAFMRGRIHGARRAWVDSCGSVRSHRARTRIAITRSIHHLVSSLAVFGAVAPRPLAVSHG
jgi:hypothetical protein